MVDTLSAPQQCADFFRAYLRTRLHHWRDHAAIKTIEIATLDAEQEQILKAITLGLDLTEAWAVVCDLIIAFAPYMERRGHWESWHVVLEHASGAAQRMGDTDSEITLTVLLAKLCQRQSRAQDVVRYYRRVIRLARRAGNRYELARACSNLGYFYIDGGRWWRAEILNQHALAIFIQLESEHGCAHTHNHLGALYIRQQQWLEAEEHLQQAFAYWQQMGDIHGSIYGSLNLGVLYVEQALAQKAMSYLTTAYQQASVAGEKLLIGNILNNMAIVHRLNRDFAQALLYAQQAEQIFREHHNTLELAHVWHNLGLIYGQNNQFANANEYVAQALRIYRQLGNQFGEQKLISDLNHAALPFPSNGQPQITVEYTRNG